MFLSQQQGIVIQEVLKMDWAPIKKKVAARPMDALSFRIKGTETLIDGDKRFSLKSGDILYMPKGKAYSFDSGTTDIIVVHFVISGEPLPEIEQFTPHNKDRFALLFEEMYTVWTRKEAGYYNKTLSLFYGLLTLLEQNSLTENESEIATKLQPAFIYLQENLTSPDLTVKALQEQCHFGATHFRTLFTRYCGVSPADYILNKRISLACEYLKTGQFPVKFVAEQCGFGDSKHFAVMFKKKMGISPLKYKNNQNIG